MTLQRLAQATKQTLRFIAGVSTLIPNVALRSETAAAPEVAPTTVVERAWDSAELIGPYNQPRWSSRGRFSGGTDVYVIPPYDFVVDVDYQATIPREGRAKHLFTQELELGLPHRFQIAYENNVEIKNGHSQVQSQVVEGRWALADWGKIPLNPTLFGEYKFGVGKDYDAATPGDPIPRLADAFELRLLLAEELSERVQWALNVFHEHELAGECEWETGFSQSVTYSINGEHLKAGVEMQFIRSSDRDDRWHPGYEFLVGPSLAWKPTKRTRLDVAALFGATEESPAAKIFAVFSYNFGKSDQEAEGPVSTRNR